MASTDDLYAVFFDHDFEGGGVMHGHCAEKKYGEDLPDKATPVLYGDAWRAEVSGLCKACGLFVDPEATP